MTGSIEILSWNLNGIRAVANKNGFTWLDERDTDILFFQEIKATEDQVPVHLFELYPNHSINSAEKKGYSGTMALSKFAPDDVRTCKHIDTLNEGRIIEQRYGDLCIFGIYFPNGQKDEERLAYKLKFYEDFLAYCDALRNEGKSIIFCGDVNTAHREIDLARPKANEGTSGFLPIERAWIDKVIAHGYIDTFRYVHGDALDHYSWWSYRAQVRAKNIGWRIDYFFVSDDLAECLEDAFILEEIEGSDHCPVGIRLSL